jgi:hypothetical protein
MEWIEIADTATKIGLGAAISGISAYLIAGQTHKNDINKEAFKKRTGLIENVAQPIDPFAKALSDLLLAGLLGKEKRKPKRIELSASFLIRESTGACPVPSGPGNAKDSK